MIVRKFHVNVDQGVERDMEEIYDWYKSRSQTAAFNFVKKVDTLLRFLTTNALLFPKQKKELSLSLVK